MTYLLDVNLLIALSDNFHVHHDSAHRWFGSERRRSWATCPLTENGLIRITSTSTYPGGHGTVSQQRETLRDFCAIPGHVFWADNLSLLDDEVWSGSALVLPAQLTDLYLLALAVKNGGKLASFDRKIPADLIRGGREALLILSA